MANFVTRALSKLINSVAGSPILVGELLQYDISPQPTIIDLSANQLITKAMAEAISGGGTLTPISLPSGSAKPFIVDMTLPEYLSVSPNCIVQVEQLNDVYAAATEAFPIYDVKVTKVWTDDTRTTLSQLVILGHDDGTDLTHTIDELQIILK